MLACRAKTRLTAAVATAAKAASRVSPGGVAEAATDWGAALPSVCSACVNCTGAVVRCSTTPPVLLAASVTVAAASSPEAPR